MLKNSQKFSKFIFGTVDDEATREKLYKLRYEVYVEEFKFEKKDDHPGEIEKDEYDDNSVHFACLNDKNDVIGTMRIILNSKKGFPLEKATKIEPLVNIDKDNVVEVSRLSISDQFRRRKEDGFYGVESYLTKKDGGILSEDQDKEIQQSQRKNPAIILGLIQVMYHETKRRGITHWYMICEDKLFNTLKKYNFTFFPVGKKVFYHGWRTPYLLEINQFEKNLQAKDPGMLQILISGLDKKYIPDFLKK